MDEAFENADFYSCSADSEQYEAKTPNEAIVEEIDAWFEVDVVTTVDSRLRVGPLIVHAFMRTKIPETWFDVTAEDMLELAFERFDEEYADPNHETETSELRERYMPRIRSVLKDLFAEIPVWSCEECGSREYGRTEVLEILRKHNPEWFDDEPGQRS